MKKMIVALSCMFLVLICCLIVLITITQPKEKEIFTTYLPNIADKKPIEMAEAAEIEADEYEEPVYEYYEPTYYNYHDNDYDDMSAKDYIAQRESGQDYEAVNGQYYGKYQLQIDMLGGDLSPENQEATAERYMEERYGSWENAQEFWDEHGWW